MKLHAGLYGLPAGTVAAIVTTLEMRDPAPFRGIERPGLCLERRLSMPPKDYRALYARIGHDWLWFSRLSLAEAALRTIIHDPAVEVWVLSRDGADEGLLELDFRMPGVCELAFFGLSPALIGRGAGRWLMDRAIATAWTKAIDRFWVHTCTLDHPAALAFYRRSGFVVVGRHIEVADDPRLTGVLAGSAAPQVPILP